MRISSYAVARPAYYDRNATSSYASYDAPVGPHGNTTRWTITVAVGKKLLVEQATTQVYRTTAATVVMGCGSQIWYVGQIFQTSSSSSNSVGLLDKTNLMTGVTLYAGETMYGNTYDGSTGGTVTFTVNYKGTLFDA